MSTAAAGQASGGARVGAKTRYNGREALAISNPVHLDNTTVGKPIVTSISGIIKALPPAIRQNSQGTAEG